MLGQSDRVDSRLAPSQWETSLQSKAVAHWLGANLESALKSVELCYWWANDMIRGNGNDFILTKISRMAALVVAKRQLPVHPSKILPKWHFRFSLGGRKSVSNHSVVNKVRQLFKVLNRLLLTMWHVSKHNQYRMRGRVLLWIHENSYKLIWGIS